MSSNGSPSRLAAPPRRFRPKLRQATLILPKTGERIKKTFTLRAQSSNNLHGTTDERQSLLSRSAASRSRKSQDGFEDHILTLWKQQFAFWTSVKGIGILKCSLAYVLGSLATFVPPISNTLGRNDGKHMVATVCVYFHPARSAGSMAEATVLAAIAFAYAAAISFSSMAVSAFFNSHGHLVLGHIVVLIVFCGGGLGLVGWIKQRLGNPLVNVGCSLTSLALITVLTKEGAVQAGEFSYAKILQVLKMVAMGIVAAMAVSLCIRPQSARKALRKDFIKITDLQEEILTTITRSFLSGTEEDLKGPSFTAVQDNYRSTFNAMVKDLREAKFEHYMLGTETIHGAEARLVKCIERLGQSLIGLRSAAETQFELLRQPNYGITTPVAWRLQSDPASPSLEPYTIPDSMGSLHSITEEPEDSDSNTGADTASTILVNNGSEIPTSSGPSDIFSLFISQLGPAMKSLAFTLQGVLNELPFSPGSDEDIAINANFRRSLLDAKQLFMQARRAALESLYRSRALEKTGSAEMAADYEEVAASCGHFSSSLQDFAEDTIAYLDILEELDDEMEEMRRSWTWVYSWCNWQRSAYSTTSENHEEPLLGEENPARRMSRSLPIPKQNPTTRAKVSELDQRKSRMYYYLWKAFGWLRREDIKFALKVGIGAVLYASFSFIPETQPIYSHWRGDKCPWGLLSYMLVCSMTIGASNTTGLQRFFGTCLGALLAVAAWIACRENALVLGFFGWLVSLGCFYIIVGQGKGPMGRFILLTYNLSALYAYSLSVKDDDNDDDEGGVSPEIWEIVLHRVVAVLAGCLYGLIVTRVIYPISARKKLKQGISLLWLRMGLIWKRDPLTILTETDQQSTYMDIRESLELQRFLGYLDGLRESASHEFELRGPFPNELNKKILDATSRMVGAFIAMNTVIVKDLKASAGEAELLRYTRDERVQLSARVSHLFSVLASSMQIAYPITDAVPDIEHTRDRFLTKLFEFRKQETTTPGREDAATDEDYELLYAYALVTGQIAKELNLIIGYVGELYGVLDEESLRLR